MSIKSQICHNLNIIVSLLWNLRHSSWAHHGRAISSASRSVSNNASRDGKVASRSSLHSEVPSLCRLSGWPVDSWHQFDSTAHFAIVENRVSVHGLPLLRRRDAFYLLLSLCHLYSLFSACYSVLFVMNTLYSPLSINHDISSLPFNNVVYCHFASLFYRSIYV